MKLLAVQVMWIHRGDENFSGWNPFVLIHTDYGNELKRNGFIEEILVHEAAHAALDEEHADASGWRLAQAADLTFVSTYAMEHPDREDIAETFPAWMAIRYLGDRIPTNMTNAIRNSIPYRLPVFGRSEFRYASDNSSTLTRPEPKPCL